MTRNALADRPRDVADEDARARLHAEVAMRKAMFSKEKLQSLADLAKSLEHRLVFLESPYAGDVERNVRYARAAMRDSLLRGEAPMVSHLLYTQEGVLRDDVPEERAHGIAAGLAWGSVAAATVVYVNLGISKGMAAGIARAESEGRPVERRLLEGWGV